MSIQAVLLPLFVEVALTFVLLFWMARLNVAAVRSGTVRSQDIALREPVFALVARERPDIVISQVFAEIVRFAQADVVIREDLAIRLEMKRLAVGDDAIEVEHNRAQHGSGAFPHSFSFRRSPARIAAGRRFSGGGNGHSVVGL